MYRANWLSSHEEIHTTGVRGIIQCWWIRSDTTRLIQGVTTLPEGYNDGQLPDKRAKLFPDRKSTQGLHLRPVPHCTSRTPQVRWSQWEELGKWTSLTWVLAYYNDVGRVTHSPQRNALLCLTGFVAILNGTARNPEFGRQVGYMGWCHREWLCKGPHWHTYNIANFITWEAWRETARDRRTVWGWDRGEYDNIMGSSIPMELSDSADLVRSVYCA